MDKKELLDNLESLGYALVDVDHLKPAETLEALIDQDDVRLLEGFPVVLANIVEKEKVSLEQLEEYFSGKDIYEAFRDNVLLALFVYQHVGFQPNWVVSEVERLPSNQKEWLLHQKITMPIQPLNLPITLRNHEYSGERLIKAFNQYYRQQDEVLQNKQKQYNELAFHQALSELFPAKQREIILKKLDGRILTKTEKEYYSRVVKKRLIAVANQSLFDTARQLLAG